MDLVFFSCTFTTNLSVNVHSGERKKGEEKFPDTSIKVEKLAENEPEKTANATTNNKKPTG